jgi:hypothetical protein
MRRAYHHEESSLRTAVVERIDPHFVPAQLVETRSGEWGSPILDRRSVRPLECGPTVEHLDAEAPVDRPMVGSAQQDQVGE